MYIKICGITKLDQAQAIAQMGVEALGFICVSSSPRYISASAIGQITSSLLAAQSEIVAGSPKFAKLDLIGVFLNASLSEICETVTQAGLNAVQLHGNESPEFCTEMRSHLNTINPKIKLIKALRVKDQAGLEQAHLFSNVVDAILLDAYDPHMAGGTGKTLDWQMLRDFRPNCDWWLAGGLSPENVAEAIALVNPHGLDVSSGVERTAGDKDLSKVEQFVQRCICDRTALAQHSSAG
ncbi:N-(5'-phosphoribosyl)anthranilate isomerase [Pseudanabaena sp. SR411]|uniref:phosphoribosylanthranilate isomerase n=1 Tax=Pseudanabaena sp. SR411 TaxID=1980935 RepID=UPI000B984AFC|nr:phosphoribosylanthranilate isomerase [Pseudanabaena sp. SR411]OYQ65475.1 N-(5'-phosphoribosyl)anthranilate isomerase [Pseudanabaena sp. SR411]